MLEDGPFRTLLVDNGTPAGQDTGLPYPVERTYSRWRRSDFATLLFRDDLEAGGEAIPANARLSRVQCQDCHMRQAQVPVGTPDPDMQVCGFRTAAQRQFADHTNSSAATCRVPGILKGEYGPQAPVAGRVRPHHRLGHGTADRTHCAGRHRGHALRQQLSRGGDDHQSLRPQAAHQLRRRRHRMWLEVQVRDSDDTVLWSNGAWDPATGALAVDTQTKVYEIKQGIWDATAGTCKTKDVQGREAFHFVLNNCIAKDNRIPPLGFTGAADPEMAAYAYSYPTEPGDATRSVNRDVTQYAVPASALSNAAAGAQRERHAALPDRQSRIHRIPPQPGGGKRLRGRERPVFRQPRAPVRRRRASPQPRAAMYDLWANPPTRTLASGGRRHRHRHHHALGTGLACLG